MNNVFKGRSLCVIEDFSIEERRYFFKKTQELKKAILENNEAVMDSFGINDPDFGIYEVFLEDSTRTKESFRNAAKFHHAKVSELLCDSSSINKGESYADTFNMLSGWDGKHEHPTQELLDEFSFLERLNMDFSEIHLALVGDLYLTGMRVHAKVTAEKAGHPTHVKLATEMLAQWTANNQTKES